MTVTELLSITSIRRELRAGTVGCQLYLFGEVDSTNLRLRSLARQGVPEGTTVLAEGQRDGRGRRGQPWFSPSGVGMYVSTLFRPELEPRQLGTFSFIASLAATDAIATLGVRAAIKWPNDILVEGRKIGGVLVECALRGDHIDAVILGVGVNLNVDVAVLRAALGSGDDHATSLSEVAGREIDRNAFVAAYLNALDGWLDTWRAGGVETIRRAWCDRDVVTGRRVEARGSRGVVEGRAVGVSPAGSLVVQDGLGRLHTLVNDEVRILD